MEPQTSISNHLSRPGVLLAFVSTSDQIFFLGYEAGECEQANGEEFW